LYIKSHGVKEREWRGVYHLILADTQNSNTLWTIISLREWDREEEMKRSEEPVTPGIENS
jgi:hypothetical protein